MTSGRATRPALLAAALGTAAAGQILLLARQWGSGAALYAAAFALAVAWLRAGGDVPPPAPMRRGTEAALLAIVVAAAAFLRLHRLDTIPYGLDGDESKWCTQVVSQELGGKPYDITLLTKRGIPFPFLVEGAAFRLFGVSYRTAHLQNVAQSLLATLLFYLFARKLLGPAGALAAAWLMAVCFADAGAARHLFVECLTKLPVVATLAALVYAVETKHWSFYLLTGAGAAAALASHDAAFPVAAVAGLWLGWRLLEDRTLAWLPSRSDPGRLGRLALFLAPVLPRVPSILWHLRARSSDHAKTLTSLARGPLTLPEAAFRLKENLAQTLANFSFQRWPDFFVNTDGPIFNAALVPLAAVGFVALAGRFRRGQNALVPLAFLLMFFPAAVVFGHPFVRIFYPAYPAFDVLAAAGLLAAAGELASLGGAGMTASARAAAVALLAGVGVANARVILDPYERFPHRALRREIADLAEASLAPGVRLWAPYVPERSDPLYWERPILEFAAWARVPVGREDEVFRLVPYDELLAGLLAEDRSLKGLAVVYDHEAEPFRAERRRVIDRALSCFPGTSVRKGARFDVLEIPGAALARAACETRVSVVAESPGEAPAGRPVALPWRTEPATRVSGARAELERALDDVVWLEAEDFFPAPPDWPPPGRWFLSTRFAPGFSGRGFLADSERGADAEGRAALPEAGRYAVWARTHRREVRDLPLTISVAGRPFPAAAHGEAELGTWRWERLGDLDLPREVPVVLHREAGKGRFLSVFVDALVFSGDPAFDPERGLFRDALAGRRLEGAGARAVDAPALVPGRYRWRVRVLDGERLVSANGETGLLSPWTAFTVR